MGSKVQPSRPRRGSWATPRRPTEPSWRLRRPTTACWIKWLPKPKPQQVRPMSPSGAREEEMFPAFTELGARQGLKLKSTGAQMKLFSQKYSYLEPFLVHFHCKNVNCSRDIKTNVNLDCFSDGKMRCEDAKGRCKKRCEVRMRWSQFENESFWREIEIKVNKVRSVWAIEWLLYTVLNRWSSELEMKKRGDCDRSVYVLIAVTVKNFERFWDQRALGAQNSEGTSKTCYEENSNHWRDNCWRVREEGTALATLERQFDRNDEDSRETEWEDTGVATGRPSSVLGDRSRSRDISVIILFLILYIFCNFYGWPRIDSTDREKCSIKYWILHFFFFFIPNCDLLLDK